MTPSEKKGLSLPNKISIVRICMTPVFMYLLLSDWIPNNRILAVLVFVLASFSDSVDGHIARKYNMITLFGKFLDPLADKILITAALVCMIQLGLCNPWFAVIIIAREFIVTSFRIVAASRNVVMAADIWGKIKTTLQIVAVIYVLIEDSYFSFKGAGQYLLLLAVVVTVYSGYNYIAKNWHVIGNDK